MIKKLLQKLVTKDSKKDVLEKIKENIAHPQDFFHIVSLNPEIIMTSLEDSTFEHVLESADVRIIDGTGITYGCRALGVLAGERYQGVDLFSDILKYASDHRYRVLLIGGRPKVAERVKECQIREGSKAQITAIQGIADIKNPKQEELEEIFSIVADVRPHLTFLAFGSPYQEKFIHAHKERFKHITLMGVGGSFDFVAGIVPRAPGIIRSIGLEWLFRLVIQPWRIRRQARIVKYTWLVLKDMLVV